MLDFSWWFASYPSILAVGLKFFLAWIAACIVLVAICGAIVIGVLKFAKVAGDFLTGRW